MECYKILVAYSLIQQAKWLDVLCMYDTTIKQWVNVVNVYSTECHNRQQTQLATTLIYNYKNNQQ